MQAFLIALFLTIVSLVAYYLLTDRPPFEKFVGKVFGDQSHAPVVHLRRAIGALFFAAFPYSVSLLIAPELVDAVFFGSLRDVRIAYWLIALTILLVPLNLVASRQVNTQRMYPQIRDRKWGAGTLVPSTLTWILYLIAYEWLFRGFLFFASLEVMSIWAAVFVNVVIYALAHIPKGKREVIGAVPLGIVLCIATYQTNSIWVPVIAHIILALSNEWITLYHHPDINLKK